MVHSDSMFPTSPRNLVKALPEVGDEYIPGRGLRPTFPADTHSTLGPVKSVGFCPLTADPTHRHQWTAQPLSSPECPQHASEGLKTTRQQSRSSTSYLGFPGVKCTDEQPYA
ncbi:hypothetical protein ATANTOWER_013199 [Ataeniobius toweri]|uniref:Uncharacterized protein n=1 Tax=Ataeniobius toweri TaxID=208326 RepID=A0ABU7A7D1_9TELE|nr:hypothetical protein [Ataeniobius toweri]